MTKLLIGVCAAGMLVLASCQQSSQPNSDNGASAPMTSQKSTQTDEDFSTVVINTCCSDTVTITGKEHIVSNPDASHTHINLSGLTGTGTSGNTYHGGLDLQETINTNNGASEVNLIETFTMTSPSGCKFRVQLYEHMTTNANGDVTAVRDSTKSQCF